MKFELKPTIIRAGVLGGVIALILSILGAFVPLVGCLGFLLYIGVGAYAVMLGRQAGGAINEMPQDGIDGAIAGVITGLIGGIVALVLLLLRVGTSAGSASDAAAGVAIVGAFGSVGVLCTAFIGGAILGAVGGIVYGMIAKNQGGAPAAPKM